MNSKEEKILGSFTTVGNIPEAKRTFAVGEPVDISGVIKAVVTDTLFGGRFIEVEFEVETKACNISASNLAGNSEPLDMETLLDGIAENELTISGFIVPGQRVKDFFPWFQVFKAEPKTEETFFDNQMKLKSYISTIGGLLNKAYFCGINFEPDYQRGLVWELEDKVKLIESIQEGVNVGLFVFATIRSNASEGPLFEITDGKQRLTTLKEYFEDGFKVNDLYFSELTSSDRQKFLGHTVEVVSLGQALGENRKAILKSFLILNKSGKKIDPKHLEYVQELYESAEEYHSTQFVIKRLDD
jgi:hypothetical protein